MPLDLFSPVGATVTLSATTTSGSTPVALTVPTASMTFSCRVYNAGTATVFVTFGVGTGTTAATATSMPIPSGGIETFELGPNITYAAGITAASTATVYFTTGRGA